MASEMTTAEMVGTLRLAASHGRNTKPAAHSRCDELDAIANRLAALDKDATAALARAEKAEKERDELRGVVVTVDTPNEVCDGTYAATLGTIIDAYGTEALGWLTNQECDWKQRAEKAEALYAKAWEEVTMYRERRQFEVVTGKIAADHDAARKEAGL